VTTEPPHPRDVPDADYPPEPWDLRGTGYVSLWCGPVGTLPALPPGLRPIRLFGRAVVATAFVDYQPGGLLAYHELLVAVLVHRRGRPGISITDIWVDSAASRAGGRQLWGIPKELARFDFTHPIRLGAEVDGAPLAGAAVRHSRHGLRLPFPVRGTTFQSRIDVPAMLLGTPLRATGRLHPARVGWEFAGPLSWLRSWRPLVGVAATEFALRFGR
jgi:hypothetical protein